MKHSRLGPRSRFALLWITMPILAMTLPPPDAQAQRGTLAEPFPSPAGNAALDYQRALLHLAALDTARLKALDQPIWQTMPEPAEKTIPHQIANLLYRGRYAIRSATAGSRAEHCDFGLDFTDLGAAQPLPHLAGMVRLGRLLTLRAALAESRGEWEEAAIIYFDGLRIGRHMARQNTLLEAMAGIEILRNNYVGLSRWSIRCPSRPLVARAFGLLESMQRGMVDPSVVLAREASILSMGFGQLREAYPEGNWAVLILDSYGLPVSGDVEADRTAARQAAMERGVPEEAFKDEAHFQTYVRGLEATAHRFVEALAACVALPPEARLSRGRGLAQKYSKLITILQADTLIDPVETGVLFAEHEAELATTRVVLALAASRQKGQFPDSLDEVADRFGGRVPANPYSGASMAYQTHSEKKGFELRLSADGPFPTVRFDTSVPIAADQGSQKPAKVPQETSHQQGGSKDQ